MATAPGAPQRILIIRPSALGDVARSVPALVSMKKSYPGAQIDWLVNDSFTDVIRHHPDLHQVIPFPRGRFRGLGRNWAVTREVFAWLGDLKRKQYDRVYDLQGLGRSGLFTWCTHAALRIGSSSAREGAWLAYNFRVPTSAAHTVDQMLQIIEGADTPVIRDMRLYVGETDRQWADHWLAENKLKRGGFLALAPTARWASKRWPVESFKAIAGRAGELGLSGAVVLGAPGEESQTRPLSDTCHDLTGKTTIGRMMAILDAAGLLIANDSAALHIAVGLGRRCVAVFGPTDPRKVGPYRYERCVVRAEVDPGVNYRDSDDSSIMQSIGVERVWAAAQGVMAASPPEVVHG